MAEEQMTLTDRLRNPSWCHSNVPFDSPQLAKDETLDDMRAAADRIELLETSETNELLRMRMALREAERFMAYFAGETGGSFVGSGTPQTCLTEIRNALASAACPSNKRGAGDA